MKQVKLMLVIASFFCIFSCTREPILVEMENSSEEDIVVEFDDRPPFTLPKKVIMLSNYHLEIEK